MVDVIVGDGEMALCDARTEQKIKMNFNYDIRRFNYCFNCFGTYEENCEFNDEKL